MTDVIVDQIANRSEGRTIRDCRRFMGMTQVEIAEIFGVSKRQWGRYETGKTPFPRRYLFELLSVHLAYLEAICHTKESDLRSTKTKTGSGS